MTYHTITVNVPGDPAPPPPDFHVNLCAHRVRTEVDALRDLLPLDQFLRIVEAVDALVEAGLDLAEMPPHIGCPYCCPDCIAYAQAVDAFRQDANRNRMPHRHPCTCP